MKGSNPDAGKFYHRQNMEYPLAITVHLEDVFSDTSRMNVREKFNLSTGTS